MRNPACTHLRVVAMPDYRVSVVPGRTRPGRWRSAAAGRELLINPNALGISPLSDAKNFDVLPDIGAALLLRLPASRGDG